MHALLSQNKLLILLSNINSYKKTNYIVKLAIL